MTRLILAVAAVLGLSEVAPAAAQFVGGPFPLSGYGYSSYSRGGFGFSFGGPHFRVSGFSGGFVTRSAFVAPPVFVAPFGPVGFAPVVPAVAFANPFLGGWAPPVFAPPGFVAPAVAVPVPIPVVVGGGNLPDPNQPPPNVPPRDNGALLPRLARPDDFLVIAPRRDPVPAELPRPADVRPPAPPGAFDPKKAVVKAEEPDKDPKREAARLLKLGRASFAAGEYGRAAEHFERASAADPGDAVTYFLHAQAKFAAGQFAEAAVRVRDGLARDPKWPAARFDPTELYGDRPERFFAHRFALKKAVDDNPGQVALEFLLGYQLWFSGDRAEANRLFRAAEARVPDPGPLALFKLP